MSVRSIIAPMALAISIFTTSLVAQPQNGLGGQRRNDNLPLKAWSAPLYFQPTAEEDRTSKSNRVGIAETLATSPVVTESIPASALVFVAMTPCRIVDTRAAAGFSGSFGPPDLTGGMTRTFPILSNTTCPLPATAQAYSFNITVVPSNPLIF